ncbi:MAG TPA: hypothetical protein VKP11_11715, partial [Frankiaceae bacterium]|nr:hypothetical protein [Frankiaceae bacterium]
GQGSLPTPAKLGASDLGESTEGRLAELTGTVLAAPQKGTSGDLAIDLADAAGTSFHVIADGSSQILATDLVKGRSYRLTGIVGQRASRKGALDGYRMYLRDRADIVSVAIAAPSAGASDPPPAVTPISMALALPDGTAVTIEAAVTAGVTLLDSSGRRVVVDDASGAVEVYLPAGTAGPAVGTRLRVTGVTGHAWSAPRIAATLVTTIAGGASTGPTTFNRAPGERDEWQLVRISGSIVKVERLGDRWRAEIQLGDGTKVPVQGQPGAGIPSTAIVAGRRITVTGIVKRPYPTASDRRFAILPRDGNDVSIGPADGQAPSGSVGWTGNGSAKAAIGTSAADVTPDTDLAVLLDHVGQRVRIGGLVARLATGGFDLDDGTAIARVELQGDMAALVGRLHEGDAVAAAGVVQLVDGAPIVVVGDDGTLVRVGSLGQAVPIGGDGAQPGPSATGLGGGTPLAADSTGIPSGAAPTSVLAMIAISLMSVLATLVRRRLQRRRLRLALVDRLTTLRPRVG